MYMRKLLNIIRFIVDMIFPPGEDALLVRDAKSHELATLMKTTDVRGIEALLPFRIPIVRAAIHEAKFHGSKKAFDLLGNVLHERLAELPEHEYMLIPIPLSGSRKRQRGYNQAAEIAKAAAAGLPHIKIREDLVKRTRNTKPQTDLPKEKREDNVKDAFLITNPEAIAGKRIILFDDVVTTGATMRAAKEVTLEKGPESVILVAVAH